MLKTTFNKENIKLNKGRRQRDTISPKLLTLLMEHIGKYVNRDNRGINNNGCDVYRWRSWEEYRDTYNELRRLQEREAVEFKYGENKNYE